jgi:hypothetical protein
MSPLPPPAPPAAVFPRLMRMLRPQWGAIALAVVFLLLSLPAELFPGLTWMYVTDELILRQPTRATRILHTLFSLGGHLSNRFHPLKNSR